MDVLRKKLLGEMKTGGRIDPRGLKPHQVHELAAAKLGMFSVFRCWAGWANIVIFLIAESERLRNALGISADYEEGSHWRKQGEEKERRREQRENEYAKSKGRESSP